MALKNWAVFAASVILTSMQLPRVLAQEDGGLGGDMAGGFGIASIVVFALAVMNGFLIFASTRKRGAIAFKNAGIKSKYFWKTHHLFTIPAFALALFHGILFLGGGGEGSMAGTGWVAFGAMGILCVVGVFFPVAKGNARKVLRVVHLTCMTIVAIMIGIHIAGGD